MAKSAGERIARLVEAAQPQCEEPLIAATICNHGGTFSRGLSRSLSNIPVWGLSRSKLPNPVLIAVGPTTVYAFKFKPSGFTVKLKRHPEAARWSRQDITVEMGEAGMVQQQFTLVMSSGDSYPLETPVAMGGHEIFDMFIAALESPGPQG